MELNIGQTKEKIELSDDIFARKYNEALIHQVMVAYLAASRAGTKAQKTRAEVRGGGAKPWKQKGTGRARAGTIRSPIWKGGGATFAAKPRCYKQKVNKKMYKGAMCAILSELIRQNRIEIVNDFKIDECKTKSLLQKIGINNKPCKSLIISEDVNEHLYLAARNVPYLHIANVRETTSNPVLLINAEKVIVTRPAIKEIEELLK